MGATRRPAATPMASGRRQDRASKRPCLFPAVPALPVVARPPVRRRPRARPRCCRAAGRLDWKRSRMTSVPPFWQCCLDAFRAELTPQQFNTWIRPLAVAPDDAGYRVLAPNRFVLQWVKERFAPRIEQLAEAAEGRAIAISLGVAQPQLEPARPLAAPSAPPAVARPVLERQAEPRAISPVAAPTIAPPAPMPSRRHDTTSLN